MISQRLLKSCRRGQYHWVSEVAPKKYQRFHSYMTGWLCVGSCFIAGCRAVANSLSGDGLADSYGLLRLRCFARRSGHDRSLRSRLLCTSVACSLAYHLPRARYDLLQHRPPSQATHVRGRHARNLHVLLLRNAYRAVSNGRKSTSEKCFLRISGCTRLGKCEYTDKLHLCKRPTLS